MNNNYDERHEMSHTSQTSEHEGGFYSEVKTIMRPQEGFRESGENPFASPQLDGINAPFIDLEALKRLAPLFVRLPESKPTFSDPKKGYGSIGSTSSSHHHCKYTLYSEKTGLIRAEALLDIANSTLPEFLCQNVFWLDILDPSIDEIRALAEIFRLHQLTLENMELDADDPEAREKCDVFEDYFYINLKAIDTELSSGLGPLVSINMAILAFPGMVITTHKEPLHLHRTVAKRIRLLTARSRLSADWIVYALLEDVIDFFSVSGQDIEIEVDSIDELVMVLSVNDQEDMLHRIGSIRKRVVQQLRFVSNKNEIFRIIVKRASHRFSEDAGFYLRDLHEHVAMLDQNMDQYDESLNRSHNNYLAQVSIEISHTSNKLNDVMKKLTVAASVALPWTVISALWGMNIDVPGQDDGYKIFWILIAIMLSLSMFTYLVGRHRKWF
jgi:magnesium transporter